MYVVMSDRTIIEDIRKRGESILSYYHIFAYAASSRKEYRQGKYEGYDFALLIFTVISCIEDLHINQKECTKKNIIDVVSLVLVDMGVNDINPEDLVNEVITNCLENNGIIIKKESCIKDLSPSINLIHSKNLNRGGSYTTTYDLSTSTLNMLYSTKEFFDVVSQSNIIIKKQLQKGNIYEAIRESLALRSTIGVELDEVDKMIDNIRNNIYSLDVLKVNNRMQGLLDEIVEHQKETSLIIASIDNNEESVRLLTQKDKVKIKGVLNEVSKMEIKLLTNIQECIRLLDDNILNFDFITNHNTVNIFNDIITPLERDTKGLIKLDQLFAPLFALPSRKIFDLGLVFQPQQVLKPDENDVHYMKEYDSMETDEEAITYTNDTVTDCTSLFYLLLDMLTVKDDLTIREFIDETPFAKEKLSALRLLALYLFTTKSNTEEIQNPKINMIDGDYHTSIRINDTERTSFSVLNEFFLYPKKAHFKGYAIVITPQGQESLEYSNDQILIRIPNMRFRKIKKDELKNMEGGTL